MSKVGNSLELIAWTSVEFVYIIVARERTRKLVIERLLDGRSDKNTALEFSAKFIICELKFFLQRIYVMLKRCRSNSNHAYKIEYSNS